MFFSEANREKIKQLALVYFPGGFPTAGRRGRPAAFDMVLGRMADELLQSVRDHSAARARRIPVRAADERARRGLHSVLAQRRIDSSPIPYKPSIDGVLRAAYPKHRPPDRWNDTIRFIDEGLLDPWTRYQFDRHRWETVAVANPLPDQVPNYTYSPGPHLLRIGLAA